MQFWSGKEVTVHVMDGSAEPLPAHQLAAFENNIRYHHHPVSIFDRIAIAIDLVNTEFAVFHGDDEFFIPDALLSCISALDDDASLVSCMGRCVLFNRIDGDIKARRTYLEMKDYEVNGRSGSVRMRTHMRSYNCSYVYAVMRSKEWKQMMSIVTREQFPVFSIEEYQVEMIGAYLGSCKVLPVLYWFRSDENTRITQDGLRFNNWWIDPSYAEMRERFLNRMVENLSVNNPANPEKIRTEVIKACDAFTKWSFAQGLGMAAIKQSTLVRKIKNSIAYRLPFRVKNGIARLKGKRKNNIDKTMYPLRVVIEQLQAEGVHVPVQDVESIGKCIKEFYQNKNTVLL
jgi:glycosyltransferase domain-containing protein